MQPGSPPQTLRCAIYTRKSTEEGLGRELNSLESQRDTCSAYVRSQRHKGWSELPERYDDGGWSGGDLARPALQRLLADVEAARVDVIVIYKIDRLTRSLLDFVRLVDTLERFEVAFVSVTQAFDTSDSMGRLVLNVLLTFAQFERELISDRLRDKFATMRRHGKCIGGRVPFGYERVNGRLVIHEGEAAKVREIYDRYCITSSGNQLLQQLRAEGLRNKARLTRAGKEEGGNLFGPGILHRVLTNPLYLGKVEYRGQRYEGEQDAIVTQDQWDRVQALRAERHGDQIPREPTNSLLLGILFDAHGRRMKLDVVERAGKRYRYYATELTNEGRRQKLKVLRAGAEEVERLAVSALRSFLCDRPRVSDALSALGFYDEQVARALRAAPAAAAHIAKMAPASLRHLFKALFRRAELDRERLRLFVSCVELGRLLTWDKTGIFKAAERTPSKLLGRIYVIDVPAAVVREARAVSLPLVSRPLRDRLPPDRKLVQLLEEAREAQALAFANREQPLGDVAREHGSGPAFFSRLVRLNYLAPDIVTAILDGRQPTGLTRRTMLYCALPLDWAQQRQLFGFAPLVDEGRSTSATWRGHAPRTGGAVAL